MRVFGRALPWESELPVLLLVLQVTICPVGVKPAGPFCVASPEWEQPLDASNIGGDIPSAGA